MLALADGARRFAEAGEWLVEETREDRVRTVDVRRFVERIEVVRGSEGEWYAEFTAAVTPTGTARPESGAQGAGAGLRSATHGAGDLPDGHRPRPRVKTL